MRKIMGNEVSFLPLRQERIMVSLIVISVCALIAWLSNYGTQGGLDSSIKLGEFLPIETWHAITSLGDERILLALALPFFYRYPRLLWALVLASLLGWLASRGLKHLLHMPRPSSIPGSDAAKAIFGRRSGLNTFPSGHTVSVIAFACVWFAVSWRKAFPLLIAALIVGFSRIMVGAHWPADVLGGIVVGCVSAWAGARLALMWNWGCQPLPHLAMMLFATIAAATLPFVDLGYPESFGLRVIAAGIGLAASLRNYFLPLMSIDNAVIRDPNPGQEKMPISFIRSMQSWLIGAGVLAGVILYALFVRSHWMPTPNENLARYFCSDNKTSVYFHHHANTIRIETPLGGRVGQMHYDQIEWGNHDATVATLGLIPPSNIKYGDLHVIRLGGGQLDDIECRS
jgi:membrane-associated phospholipid phosphatase